MSGGGNAVGALANVFHGVASGHGGGGVLGAMVHAENVKASVQGQMALSEHAHALGMEADTHQTDNRIRLSRATTDHQIDLVGAQSRATVDQMRTAGDEHRTSMRTAYGLGAPVPAPKAPVAPRGPQTPQSPSTPSVQAPVVSAPKVSTPTVSAPVARAAKPATSATQPTLPGMSNDATTPVVKKKPSSAGLSPQFSHS